MWASLYSLCLKFNCKTTKMGTNKETKNQKSRFFVFDWNLLKMVKLSSNRSAEQTCTFLIKIILFTDMLLLLLHTLCRPSIGWFDLKSYHIPCDFFSVWTQYDDGAFTGWQHKIASIKEISYCVSVWACVCVVGWFIEYIDGFCLFVCFCLWLWVSVVVMLATVAEFLCNVVFALRFFTNGWILMAVFCAILYMCNTVTQQWFISQTNYSRIDWHASAFVRRTVCACIGIHIYIYVHLCWLWWFVFSSIFQFSSNRLLIVRLWLP